MPAGVSIQSCSTKCIDSNGPKETQNPPCASRKKSAEKVVLHHRPYTVPWTAHASHTPDYLDYPAWVWHGAGLWLPWNPSKNQKENAIPIIPYPSILFS